MERQKKVEKTERGGKTERWKREKGGKTERWKREKEVEKTGRWKREKEVERQRGGETL